MSDAGSTPGRSLARLRWRDLGATALVSLAVVTLVAILAWILVGLVVTAWPRLDASLLAAEPRDAGRAGGLGSIVVSSLAVLAVCLAVVAPLALGCALALTDARRAWSRVLRTSLDVLTGLPSIVLGLFGLLIFGDLLGLGFSLLTGGLTLACMVLPIVIRVAEAALRQVPMPMRTSAIALGLSRSTRLFHLEWRPALPGLLAAFALGLGRALAETAVLLFTAGSSDRMPRDITDPGRTLSVHIYEVAMQVAGGDASAAASALVLLGMLAIIQIPTVLLLPRLEARGMPR